MSEPSELTQLAGPCRGARVAKVHGLRRCTVGALGAGICYDRGLLKALAIRCRAHG
ncbi:MAG: hypothetical protein ACRDCX_09395 [Aeromonas sp.]